VQEYFLRDLFNCLTYVLLDLDLFSSMPCILVTFF